MACNHFNNFHQKPPGIATVDAAMSRIIITDDLDVEYYIIQVKVDSLSKF